MLIDRVRVDLTGFPGGPGVSTFYAIAGPTLVPQVRTFYAAIISQMPAGVVAHVEDAGDSIDDTNGTIGGSWTVAPGTDANSTHSAAYAAASGGLVKWLTSTILDGHRLRGHTFIVPMAGDAFATDGGLLPGAAAILSNAAAALVTASAGNLVVWHRPKHGPRPAAGGPRPVIRVGGHGVVTGSSVPTKSAVLRSRRD